MVGTLRIDRRRPLGRYCASMIAPRMPRVLVSVLAAWLVACSLALPTYAHPLGNTTVNVYERIELGRDGIRIRYILDASEIPAGEEQRFADTNDDGIVDDEESHTYLEGLWVYVQPNLILTVDDQVMPLTRETQTLTFPPGQGGLTLLRAVYDTVAPYPTISPGSPVPGSFLETTFEGVLGWHEIIVLAGPEAALLESTVPADDLTDELTLYPADRLNDPLSVREASFRFSLPGGSVGPSPGPSSTPLGTGTPVATRVPGSGAGPGASPNPGRPTDPLVALIGPELTPLAIVLAIFVALGLGALHAISPGHGKTLIAAYLIGTRSNVAQALWLGLTVAITHTTGVFLLGVATYLATEWVVPDRIVSWLTVATGALVLLFGISLVWRTWNAQKAVGATRGGHEHPQAPGMEHSHEGASTHSHAPATASGGSCSHSQRRDKRRRRRETAPETIATHESPNPMPATLTLRRREVAALGVVGGLIPSGSALLLLLSSVALGQVALGVILIVAFGVGMALVLAGIATGVVLMHRSSIGRWERLRDSRVQRVIAAAPLLSGALVSIFGLLLTVEAIRTLR